MKNFLDEISEIDVEGATEIADGSQFEIEPTIRDMSAFPTSTPSYLDEDSEGDTEYDQTSVLALEQSDEDATAVESAIDGRFQLVGVLGEGGMGKVYRGIQLSINRDVAIKVVREEFAHDPQLRARFEREAQLISSFNHPGIVRLVDFGESDGRLFLVMEFVNGKPIGELFGGHQFHPRYVLEMARQVASALTEAHSKGVVHRDLKPDNILLSRVTDGTIQFKVLDFGVARTGSSNLTAAGTVCGTPEYMPPEQARGMTVGPESDLYALGVMMYEMLAGRVPFAGNNAMAIMIKQVKELPPRLKDLAPHVPDDIEELVNALMEKEPADRISSAISLCDTIDHILAMHGWNQVIRLEDGPLNQTTKKWYYDGSPIVERPSAPTFPHSPNTSQDLVAPKTPVSSAALSTGFLTDDAPIGIDEDALAQNRRPNPANYGYGQNQPTSSPANRLPTPAPQAHAPAQPTQSPQRAARPRQNTLPGASRNKRNKTNTILLGAALVLVVLMLVVVALILSRKAGGPELPADLGSGPSPAMLTSFAASGWTPSAVIASDLGPSVNVQSSKLVSANGQVSFSVYTCTAPEECGDIFDRIYLPSYGYMWSGHVVLLEPMGNVPKVEMERLISAVTTLHPGGEASTTDFK